MVKQCKGKDLAMVTKSKLLKEDWISSIKYDGNYVQIHKLDDTVDFYTSGGKPFYHKNAADILAKIPGEFILEAEYIATSEGKLGDRVYATKLTTLRTNYSKGLTTPDGFTLGDQFKVFDIIIPGVPFKDRLDLLKTLPLEGCVNLVNFSTPYSLDYHKEQLGDYVGEGYEGLYLKHTNHLYLPGKRVNDAIKLKGRLTADLRCIDVEEGEGKYQGLIGSLVLIDSKGNLVKVGSGLTDSDRQKPFHYFLDKIVEIGYEQIIDTYIQPTFIQIREDKNA